MRGGGGEATGGYGAGLTPKTGDAAAAGSLPPTPSTLRHRRPTAPQRKGSFGVGESEPIGSVVYDWTAKDVGDWMTELGHGVYAEAFVENGVDGITLMELTEQDLQHSLAVTHLGRRKAMTKSIAALVGMGHSPQSQAVREKLRGSVQRLVGEHVEKRPASGNPGGVAKWMTVITSSISVDKKNRTAAAPAPLVNSPTSRNYVPGEGTDEGDEEAEAS